MIVHMGGDSASILGRLEFNWKLNYNGIPNPPLDKTDKNKRPPSAYFRSNILVDTMGCDPIGVKAEHQAPFALRQLQEFRRRRKVCERGRASPD